MRKNDTRILTSVKVDEPTFTAFKLDCITSKFSIQKLVDRGMYLYLNDPEFRSKLQNCNNLEF